MKGKKLTLLALLILVNIILAQKTNYEEILANTKNVKSVYLNQNSMLLKTELSKLKLVDLISKREEEIKIPSYIVLMSQTKNDKYFVTYSEGENNHKGMLINANGIKSTIEISTSYAKISDNGKYIITTKNGFSGGHFQMFDTETLQEIDVPQREYSLFTAEFIDTNRVFLLYQSMSRKSKNDSTSAIINNYKEKAKNNEISKEELYIKINDLKKKNKTKKGRETIRKAEYDIKTNYMIYNVSSQEVEYDSELIVDYKKYHFSESIITLSENGTKVLM